MPGWWWEATRAEHDVLMPTLLADVTPDMQVSRTEVFGPLVGVAAYDDLRRGRGPGQRQPLRPAGRRVHLRHVHRAAAADRLDFGGVLINEVPTWRADQQPYGGVRDSGNTREGPPFTVQEMTERRMIVIQGYGGVALS